jgi:hypothetical protein
LIVIVVSARMPWLIQILRVFVQDPVGMRDVANGCDSMLQKFRFFIYKVV